MARDFSSSHRDRPAMIIPLDIAVWLAAGTVFFAFVVALAAD
jgi:hypothetical protein